MMPVFGKEPEDRMHRVMSEIVNRVNDNTKRLRDLERTYDTMANRMIATEQDIIAYKKSVQKDIDEIKNSIDSINTEIMKIKETIKEIMKQMKFFATKTKVEELKTMLNIFNPLESVFVTRDEVRKMIKEEMSR